MSKTKIFIILVAISVILPFFNRVVAQNPTDAGKYNSKKDQLVTVKTGDITSTLKLAGSIDALDKAEVRFETSGRLAWVGVKEGDFVKKGQALASLDKTELKKALKKQSNDYLTQFSTWNDVEDSYKETKERYLVTDAIKRILERNQYSLGNAVVDYELADLAIKYATITSPISGIVVHVDQPHTGINITPATATFQIINPDSICFRADIDQEDVNNVRLGQSTNLSIDSFPDKTIESEISYIAFIPVTGQTSTVYETRFNLPANNQDLKYRLGMTGDAEIITGQAKNVVTLPIEAVYSENNQNYVLIKNQDNKLIKHPVTIGLETDSEIEIKEGLATDSQVVIKGK